MGDRYAIPRVGIYRRNGLAALRIKSLRSYLTLRHGLRDVGRGASSDASSPAP